MSGLTTMFGRIEAASLTQWGGVVTELAGAIVMFFVIKALVRMAKAERDERRSF